MYKSWMWKQRSYREQFQAGEGGSGAGGTTTPDDQAQDDQQEAVDETSSAEQQAAQVDQQAEDDGEVVITLGDEPAPAPEDEIEGKPAPAWVKDLRKQARELAKENRALKEAQQAAQQQAAPKAEEVGPKPTLEDDDIQYDAEKYAEKVLAWSDRKKAAEAKAAAARQEQEAAAAEWQKTVASYRAAGAALKVDGFEEAEAAVMAVLSPTQQGILLQGPKTPQASAQLVAALGRNPAELKKLAEIKNPVKYAFAVADLVGQLKVVTRKQPPAAERVVRGSAGGATAVDSTEARLEAEADKTGNRTALIKYRKDKAAKAA